MKETPFFGGVKGAVSWCPLEVGEQPILFAAVQQLELKLEAQTLVKKLRNHHLPWEKN